jgi:hypothetical protein
MLHIHQHRLRVWPRGLLTDDRARQKTERQRHEDSMAWERGDESKSPPERDGSAGPASYVAV